MLLATPAGDVSQSRLLVIIPTSAGEPRRSMHTRVRLSDSGYMINDRMKEVDGRHLP